MKQKISQGLPRYNVFFLYNSHVEKRKANELILIITYFCITPEDRSAVSVTRLVIVCCLEEFLKPVVSTIWPKVHTLLGYFWKSVIFLAHGFWATLYRYWATFNSSLLVTLDVLLVRKACRFCVTIGRLDRFASNGGICVSLKIRQLTKLPLGCSLSNDIHN